MRHKELQDIIDREFDRFIDFPGDLRKAVTATSCKLFAEHVVWVTQARPAVQGEPVAHAVFASNGNIRIWCADPVQVETLRQQYGEELQPLYTAPHPTEQQPAPDVSALVEALEDIGASWHGVNTELERYMRNVALHALAAYRKGSDV